MAWGSWSTQAFSRLQGAFWRVLGPFVGHKAWGRFTPRLSRGSRRLSEGLGTPFENDKCARFWAVLKHVLTRHYMGALPKRCPRLGHVVLARGLIVCAGFPPGVTRQGGNG